MVNECDKLVNSIKRTVETLQMREQARSKTLESARVITRSFLKQGELQALQTRLEKLDSRIRINTASAMQKKHNSSIVKQLVRIETAQRRMEVEGSSKLDAIIRDIANFTKQKEESGEIGLERQITGLQSLSLNLGSLQKEQVICSKQVKILESLYFTVLRRRWYDKAFYIRGILAVRNKRTNEWIFDPEQTHFSSWLASDSRNNGLFTSHAEFSEELRDIDYAINVPMAPVFDSEVSPQYDNLRDRIRNRCSDLLIVDDVPHPFYLSHNVDFLHRTVRDFLRDYHDQLKSNLVWSFSPLLSLSKIWLALLKGLPVTDFRDRATANTIIGITDEIRYYARELEKRGSEDDEIPLIRLLDELDKTNCRHSATSVTNNHWTNARDSQYPESGQCNWIALTVQARLVTYARTKLNSDPRLLHKRGRSLLDYALRPRRVTSI
ncbi:hypothetical protein DM02DRAFT_630137 [Periconia macrospinosa]|uniref:DUF7791 domain-containing protein n=1 Tax=Periconia macrospinosa TaxID=97972 RepID=A0A2V1DLK7_9PLEO|nr:hypothetical protein DM02DRAFT_630137 [Periconia macrospinosa]